MAKRKLPQKIEETKVNYEGYDKVAKDSGKLSHKVSAGAERAASAEAKKELAHNLGLDVSDLNKEIKNHQAVSDAGLDQNKLEELNGTQYKRVASVAKKEGAF